MKASPSFGGDGAAPHVAVGRAVPYGFCPQCGAPGEMRERRINGDDICKNGHKYPSRNALTATKSFLDCCDDARCLIPWLEPNEDLKIGYTIQDIRAGFQHIVKYCPFCGTKVSA